MGTESVTTSQLRIWTAEELTIPGLQLFGYCRFNQATRPLDRHRHEDCLEFICLIKGEDTYTIGHQKYPLHGGDIFISLPGQEHFSGETHQGLGEYVWFQINPHISGELLGLSADYSQALRESLLRWEKHLITVPSEVMSYAKKLHSAISEKREKLYCIGLLVSLVSFILYSPSKTPGVDARIQAAMDYINGHLDGSLSIRELSDYCGLSESGLKHKFRQETGYTPGDYISRHRILRAKELLSKGYSVTRASADTGFNSSDYFTVVFKKYTMQTPSEYQIYGDKEFLG